MIDIITLRGTGETRNTDGSPAGMLASITDLLSTDSFSFFEPDWPASVGPDPNLWGRRWAHRYNWAPPPQSPNIRGLLSYSLGRICASQILEGVASEQYTNTDGSPLQIAEPGPPRSRHRSTPIPAISSPPHRRVRRYASSTLESQNMPGTDIPWTTAAADYITTHFA